MKYVLDTSAYTHFARGHEDVVRVMDEAAWVGLPVVVVGELRAGFAAGKRRVANEQGLARLIRHPVVQLLPVDAETAEIYAEIYLALRVAGTPVPSNDMWIAATAAQHGARVLTFDRHFQAIGRVGALVFTA